MNGKIVKAISGFYYVKTETGNIYECRGKGSFKNDNINPLVGDNVVFQVTDAKERTGILEKVGTRRNELVRPAVANVDQAMVMFAVRTPNPNLSILDRFLVLMHKQNIPTVIVFNKKDLAKGDDIKNLRKTYKDAGCKILFTGIGAEKGKNLFQLRRILRNRITVLTGPSGVGKSSLINLLAGVADAEGQPAQVGAVSAKAGRGRQTTRHTELFDLKGYLIIDTPGFSSLLVGEDDFTKRELQDAFPEFAAYKDQCPFRDCLHVKERDCAVRSAVEAGKISQSRYNSYKSILEELRN